MKKNQLKTTLLLIMIITKLNAQFLPTGTLTTDNKYRFGNIGIGYNTLPTFGTNKLLVNGDSFFSGNIGLGITNPNTKISIVGDNENLSVASTVFNFTTSTQLGARIGYWTNTEGAGIKFNRWLGGGTLYHNAYIGQSKSSIGEYGLDFRTNNLNTNSDATTSRLYITPNGNIGINTTTPQNKLEINSGTPNTSGLKFSNINSSTTPNTTNIKPLGIDSSGNVVVTASNSNVPQTVIYLSSFATLEDAINTLNNTTTASTLVVDKNITQIATTNTINTNKTISFLYGNIITIPNGSTLSINGVLDAGIFQIFSGTGIVNGTPKIDQAYPQWFKNQSDTFWTDAIQKTVNFYPRVYFIENEYKLDNTILLSKDMSHYLYGEGINSKFNFLNNPNSKFAFKLKNSNVSYDKRLVFDNLAFYCDHAIQLNDETTQFIDASNDFIMNCKISGCYFNALQTSASSSIANNPSTAIQFNKVFNSEISNNQIYHFDIGINLRGSDINTVSKNRVMVFFKYAILDEGFENGTSSLGSQNGIYNNDLLVYKGTNGEGAFVKSSSHIIMIKDNYFENASDNKAKAFIDISNFGLNNSNNNDTKTYPKHIDLRGNRLDIGENSANHTYIIQDSFASLFIDGNKSTHFTKPPHSKFINSSGYLYSDYLSTKFLPGIEREIHINSCESFGVWNNFSTTNVFSNINNGGMVIDSKNVPYTFYDPQNICSFNPKSIKLKKDIGTTKIVYIKIDQKIIGNVSELNSIPKNLKINLIARNISNSTTTAQDHFYIAIIKNPTSTDPPVWSGFGNYETISGSFNNFVRYSISPSINFDPTQNYYLVIDPFNSDKEIRSIEIVDTTKTTTQANKTSETSINDIQEHLNKLEEKIELMNTELKIIKESKSNNINNSMNNSIEVFPNPVNNILNINFNQTNKKPFEFKLYDATGKLVKTEYFSNASTSYQIDVSSLIKNNYIYKISTDDYLKTGIILKD